MDNSHGYIKADWKKFTKIIEENFNSAKKQELKVALEYLLHNPPKKQVLKAGRLVWEKISIQLNDKEIDRLRNSIVTIRNNLFHGGKFRGTITKEISRNYMLLESSIVILNERLNLNTTVKENFLERNW